MVMLSARPATEFRWSFWHRLARGGLTVAPIPGNHFNHFNPEHVPALSATLLRFMREAESAPPP
jgi:thioesterase domain-containing protein